jgi:hypothetical protein
MVLSRTAGFLGIAAAVICCSALLTYVNIALVLATLMASFALRGPAVGCARSTDRWDHLLTWFVVMSVRLIGIDRKRLRVTAQPAR